MVLLLLVDLLSLHVIVDFRHEVLSWSAGLGAPASVVRNVVLVVRRHCSLAGRLPDGRLVVVTMLLILVVASGTAGPHVVPYGLAGENSTAIALAHSSSLTAIASSEWTVRPTLLLLLLSGLHRAKFRGVSHQAGWPT